MLVQFESRILDIKLYYASMLSASVHTLKLMAAHTDDGLIRASKVYTAVGSRRLHLHYRHKGYASHIGIRSR